MSEFSTRLVGTINKQNSALLVKNQDKAFRSLYSIIST